MVTAKLKDLPKLKWRIIDELKKNQEIKKLLYHMNITPLESPDVTEELVNKNIFPFPFSLSTITENELQLRVDIEGVRFVGNAVESHRVVFEVVAPNKIEAWNIQVDGENSDRPNELVSRIVQTLKNKKFGTGFSIDFKGVESDVKVSEKFTIKTLYAEVLSIKSG